MNSRNLIAALSCLGAGLLAAILVVAKSRPPVAAGDLPDRLEPSTSVKPRTPPRASAPRATVPPTAFRWASLESTNYFEYVANLRSIGCPEDTIRDIIVADINKFYAPREAPFKADPLALGPADGLNAAARRANRLADFERRRQLRGIQKEKNALLKQLLNIQLPLEPVGSISARDYERFESAFSALPPEKRDTVREIQEEYWLSLDALRERSLARRGPEYLEALKQVSAQRKAQLAKVLTPGELEEFEMRSWLTFTQRKRSFAKSSVSGNAWMILNRRREGLTPRPTGPATRNARRPPRNKSRPCSAKRGMPSIRGRKTRLTRTWRAWPSATACHRRAPPRVTTR
jgi:hypothetical protein